VTGTVDLLADALLDVLLDDGDEVLDPLLDDGDDPQPAMPMATAQITAIPPAGRTKLAFMVWFSFMSNFRFRDATDDELQMLERPIPT
jgi:hypothetical protein